MTKEEKALKAIWKPVQKALKAWEKEEKKREKQLKKLWAPLAKALKESEK